MAQQPQSSLQKIWAEHSLSIVLAIILLGQLVAYWYQGLADWRSDQRSHGASAAIWPDYVTHYMAEVWVSVLADTYGAILLVILTKKLHERGSKESN